MCACWLSFCCSFDSFKQMRMRMQLWLDFGIATATPTALAPAPTHASFRASPTFRLFAKSICPPCLKESAYFCMHPASCFQLPDGLLLCCPLLRSPRFAAQLQPGNALGNSRLAPFPSSPNTSSTRSPTHAPSQFLPLLLASLMTRTLSCLSSDCPLKAQQQWNLHLDTILALALYCLWNTSKGSNSHSGGPIYLVRVQIGCFISHIHMNIYARIWLSYATWCTND